MPEKTAKKFQVEPEREVQAGAVESVKWVVHLVSLIQMPVMELKWHQSKWAT